MAQNDLDAVRTEFNNWKKERAAGPPSEINLFETFCAEQLLKDHNLSDEEILSGIVGGVMTADVTVFIFSSAASVSETIPQSLHNRD